jgi:hypothetical protein
MQSAETAHVDVDQWVKSILTKELWDRYCHLTYAQMARVPELAEYAEDLRQADKEWLRERTKHSH